MSTMGTMERILRLMADKKASDVYLSAHSPALIKINGQALPINSQILPPDAPLNLLSEVLPPARIEELQEMGELNMALPLAGRKQSLRGCRPSTSLETIGMRSVFR